METPCLIVGDLSDLHVRSVLSAVGSLSVAVVDVRTFFDYPYDLGPEGWRRHGSPPVEVSEGVALRGWIRRIAPPDWARGVVTDSHEAVVAGAAMSLFAYALRSPSLNWLTTLDAGILMESKLTQASAADRLGIRYPETIVTNDINKAQDRLGSEVVVKPLGPGHYFHDGEPQVVFAQTVNLRDLEESVFAAAPFLVQQRLHASEHLRVVTVRGQAWVSALNASDLPLDWRKNEKAHHAFVPAQDRHPSVPRDALRIASDLGLGYSSQDWVICGDEPYLLDVNPGGQWLFLPDQVSDAVTQAIARWLKGDDHGS